MTSSADVNGITVSYDDYGDGPAVVLVHGHPFDRSMWWPQVAALTAIGYRVVAADLRGYGGSTVVPGKTTLEMFARDTFALVDHLGLDEVVLGGLSMGGQIVMECHRLFADRIAGLVLADTFAQGETPEGHAHRNRVADRLLAEGMGGYAAENLPRMMAAYNVAAMPEVARHVYAMMLNTAPEGAAAALRGRAERRDYTELLTRVEVPTLIVVGRDDEFTPVADAESLHRLIPASALTVVDNAGHLPNLEQPEAFNAALKTFLDQ
ncbi:hydrolase [Actinoplanes sp. SE50]|uniref:alpha/beta fold hydrolase n=1 Tax=unclassified Actinoplanes TaxID=2626549 RepID=UPI00023ECD80|nr:MULTISPECIES: alpha/beta fold hydrolase [unclassified Actinoplanes]AEV87201.1 2-hydroxy-6-oxononadienedioate/2-hydroxy-6- oxononatrienedioate hydrolase 1 [Actinoplanes sp. SE50/110]ATO85602.1 hydrolase [Actinoplanes sp. SE50]SLM03015.1 hydrolase [Actinoplanes sp. SE50/110]